MKCRRVPITEIFDMPLTDSLAALDEQIGRQMGEVFDLHDLALPALRATAKSREQYRRRQARRDEELRVLQATARRVNDMQTRLMRVSRKRYDRHCALPGPVEEIKPAPPRQHMTLVQLWLTAFGMLPPGE